MSNDTLRVAMLGAGKWAEYAHIPGWIRDPRAELVVVADVVPDTRPPRGAPQRAAGPSNLPEIVIPSITGVVDTDVRATLEAWLEAWRRADIDTYLSFYAEEFTSAVEGETREQWREKRALLLADTGAADIRYDRLTIVETGGGARARFIQEFHNGGEINAVVKILELVPQGFRWLIVSEEVEMVL